MMREVIAAFSSRRSSTRTSGHGPARDADGRHAAEHLPTREQGRRDQAADVRPAQLGAVLGCLVRQELDVGEGGKTLRAGARREPRHGERRLGSGIRRRQEGSETGARPVPHPRPATEAQPSARVLGGEGGQRGDHQVDPVVGQQVRGGADDGLVGADLGLEDDPGETGGVGGDRPAGGHVLQCGRLGHGASLREAVKRHGEGRMPRLWSIDTLSLKEMVRSTPHWARWTSWAVPRVRPGHACGPAPKGNQAPGRGGAVLPPVRVERAAVGVVTGHEVVRASEEQRADEHHRPAGTRAPVELHVLGGEARGDPGRRSESQRLPHGVRRVDDSGLVLAEPCQQPRAGGDRDLDAGSEQRRDLRRGVVGTDQRRELVLEGVAGRLLRAAGAAPAPGRSAGRDDGREGVYPVQHEGGDAVAPSLVELAEHRGGGRSRDRVAQQHHRVVRLRGPGAVVGVERGCELALEGADPAGDLVGGQRGEDGVAGPALAGAPGQVAAAGDVAGEVEEARLGQDPPGIGGGGDEPRPGRGQGYDARARGGEDSAEPATGRLGAVHVHHCAWITRRSAAAGARAPHVVGLQLVGGALGLDGGADAVHHGVLQGGVGWGGASRRTWCGATLLGVRDPVVHFRDGLRTPGHAVSRRSGQSAVGCAAASA